MEEVIKYIDIMIKNTKENLRNLKIIRSYLIQLDEKEKYKDELEIKSIEKSIENLLKSMDISFSKITVIKESDK